MEGGSGGPFTTEVDGTWTVRVERDDRTLFEYHYASEKQARFMAAVFAMQPTRLPEPDMVWSRKRPSSPRRTPTPRLAAAKRSRTRTSRSAPHPLCQVLRQAGESANDDAFAAFIDLALD